MYIKKISITNIRSIDHLEIKFLKPAGWHVIIGDNGSGKSTVMRCISAALIGIQEINSILPVWGEWLRKNEKEGEIILEKTFDPKFDLQLTQKTIDKQTKYKDKVIFRLLRLYEDHATLGGEHLTWPDDFDPLSHHSGKFSAGFGPFRRFTGGDNKRDMIFKSSPRAAAHLTVFGEDIALTEALNWLKDLDRRRLKQKESTGNSMANEPQNGFLNEDEKMFESVKLFINKSGLLPHNSFFDSIDIDGDVVFKDGNNNLVKVTEMSDGYRSILSLVFELIRQLTVSYPIDKVFANIRSDAKKMDIPVPGVVLIDEVDAHLHPTWQARIGEWFTQFFPNIQFIVTTHSPLICRACEKGTIWRLAAPGSDFKSAEIKGIEKDRLVFGNILDAYGTEVFGQSPVRSSRTDEKLARLGRLNMLSAFGKINEEEEEERIQLQKTLTTDAPIS